MPLTPLGYIAYYLFRGARPRAAVRLGIREWRAEAHQRRTQSR